MKWSPMTPYGWPPRSPRRPTNADAVRPVIPTREPQPVRMVKKPLPKPIPVKITLFGDP